MAENNPHNGTEEITIDIERKDGLLEELDLPPQLIKFIRENSQRLQIAAACLVVLILCWTYYDYHVQKKEDNAAAALNAAVIEPDETIRLELLQNVTKEYSGTGAALWGRIEQGHTSFQAGDYQGALAVYVEVLDDISNDNPLRPLLEYNIGLAYENNGETDKALKHYKKLASFKGFEVKGLMSQGRLNELQGNAPEALRLYRMALENEAVSSQDKLILQDKIDAIGVTTKEADQG